jgi:hypothetical protein
MQKAVFVIDYFRIWNGRPQHVRSHWRRYPVSKHTPPLHRHTAVTH